MRRDAPGSRVQRYPRPIRGMWRLMVRTRFQLFQRRLMARKVWTEVEGRRLLVLPSVFNPRIFKTGLFLARELSRIRIDSDARVLDLGCGSGIGAIVAASRSQNITAIDINPEAVRCTLINARVNKCEDRIDVREGDLFSAVPDSRFDLILFNPPFLAGKPHDSTQAAFQGDDVARRFAKRLAHHLAPSGRCLLVLSSNGREEAFVDELSEENFEFQVVAERDLVIETLRLYELRTKR